MSELKVYRDQEDYCASTDDYILEEAYDKHEADNVIAEKDKKIIQLEALIENYNRIFGEIIDNANHQKHKRCLALSEKCGIAAQMQHDFTMRFGNPCYLKRAMFNEKWRNRWLAIAEKFKEAK